MGKSHQRGWVVAQVVARGRKWYGYFRKTVLDPVTNAPVTDVVPIVLGLKARLTKSGAREELQKEIAKQTGQAADGRVMKNGSVTFGWFVRNRYLPLREANWKPETAKVKKTQIQRDLVEKFENVPMDVIDKFMLQTHINHLAAFRSTDRVLQARSYLKSIFSEAVEQDFLLKDPSRNVTPPLNLRSKNKTVLTWDQLRLVLGSLPHRDLVLLTLEMTDALRPSELFALRWRSFEGSRLTIVETVYRGKIRPWGKTKRSLGEVHLPEGLANELWLWKQECPDPSPGAFILPNSRKRNGATKNGFIRTDNYRARALKKLAKELGLRKLNFQVLRRTIATLAQTKGSVKDVQGVLGHSKPDITANVYMQQIESGVRQTLEAIYSELVAKPGVA